MRDPIRVMCTSIAVFLVGYIFGGLFILPHNRAVSHSHLSALEPRYWLLNVEGGLLGLVCVNIMLVLRRRTKEAREKRNRFNP